MSALPTPDAIRSLASNMRRMDLLEWIERSGIATARDEKVDKDYLVERLSAAYKIAHKYSPTPVKPYVETKTLWEQVMGYTDTQLSSTSRSSAQRVPNPRSAVSEHSSSRTGVPRGRLREPCRSLR